MKISRRQLRVLIESMLYENYEKDQEQARDTYLAGKAKQELNKNKNFEDLARSFNESLRGGSDTSYIAGMFKNWDDNYEATAKSIFDAIVPGSGKIVSQYFVGGSDIWEAGTDEDLFEINMMIVELKSKALNISLTDILNKVGEEYNRLFDRNLSEDIKGDFNTNEINNLERKFKGFKIYLDA
jgi:hypothetical protein